MVDNIWVSDTPIRDEVSLLLDMDPDHPIHCDWCGLFVTYQIGFDDSVPTMCAACEPVWQGEVWEVRANNADADLASGMFPPILIADTVSVVADWEGERDVISPLDLALLESQARLQCVAYLHGHVYTVEDVERIRRLFTNMHLGTAPPRCHCRAVMPCKNHPF